MNYSIKILDSVDQLLANAGAWNSLWERTGDVIPLARAECIALWMRRFAPKADFRAIVVEVEGTFVAGIPLYLQRRAKIMRTGMLPGNEWGKCGTLLYDACREDAGAVFCCLIAGLKQLPIDFLWCKEIRFEDFPWKNFCEHWTASVNSSRTIQQHYTAVIPLFGTPETITAAWNKNEISNIKRRFRKRYMQEDKALYEFRTISIPDEVIALLPECFALEHAGWKGQEEMGGSIIKQNMEEYFLTQAKILAEQGLVRLYTLFFDDRLIAFQYGYRAGRTIYSMKISYDPALREFSPSIILRWLLNKQLLDDPDFGYLDCVGLAGSHQKIWNPNLHAVGEVVFPLSFVGKVALSCHKLYSKIKSRKSLYITVQTASDNSPTV